MKPRIFEICVISPSNLPSSSMPVSVIVHNSAGNLGLYPGIYTDGRFFIRKDSDVCIYQASPDEIIGWTSQYEEIIEVTK